MPTSTTPLVDFGGRPASWYVEHFGRLDDLRAAAQAARQHEAEARAAAQAADDDLAAMLAVTEIADGLPLHVQIGTFSDQSLAREISSPLTPRAARIWWPAHRLDPAAPQTAGWCLAIDTSPSSQGSWGGPHGTSGDYVGRTWTHEQACAAGRAWVLHGTTPVLPALTGPAATVHRMQVRRKQRGMTPIRPSRPVYASTGRCSCGWEGRDNHAPSQGGRRNLLRQHLSDTDERATLD